MYIYVYVSVRSVVCAQHLHPQTLIWASDDGWKGVKNHEANTGSVKLPFSWTVVNLCFNTLVKYDFRSKKQLNWQTDREFENEAGYVKTEKNNQDKSWMEIKEFCFAKASDKPHAMVSISNHICFVCIQWDSFHKIVRFRYTCLKDFLPCTKG